MKYFFETMHKYFLSLSGICFKSIFITSLLIIILTGNAFSNEVSNQFGTFSAVYNPANQGITLDYTLNNPGEFSEADFTMADPVYSSEVITTIPTFSHIGAAMLITIIFSMGIYYLSGKRRVLFLSISLLLLVGSGDALAGRYSNNNGITWWEILKRDFNPSNSGTYSMTLLNPGEYTFMLFLFANTGGEASIGPVTATVTGNSTWSMGSELSSGAKPYFGIWEMSDGKFLAMGRSQKNILFGQVYDPSQEAWSGTANYATQKSWNNACKIYGTDKIIFPVTSIASVPPYQNNTDTTTLIYDYSTDTWTQTGSFNNARIYAELSCLPSGEALLTGGQTSSTGLPSDGEEIYNPDTGQWAVVAPMNKTRANHKSVVLSDGRVLVIGGWNSASIVDPVLEYTAEVYDPVTDTWTDTNPLNGGRMDTEAILLPNGKVLASGGYLYHYGFVGTSEIYDPATNSWSTTGSMNDRKQWFAMVLMADGKVMAVGGVYQDEVHTWQIIDGKKVWYLEIRLVSRLSTAEIYDANTGTWSPTNQIRYRRESPFGALLPDGRILIGAGFDGADTYYTSTEIYIPD